MDAGDETAQLTFPKPSSPPSPQQGQKKGPQAPTYPPAGGKRPAVQGRFKGGHVRAFVGT